MSDEERPPNWPRVWRAPKPRSGALRLVPPEDAHTLTDADRRAEAIGVVMALLRADGAEPRDRLAAARIVLDVTKPQAAASEGEDALEGIRRVAAAKVST